MRTVILAVAMLIAMVAVSQAAVVYECLPDQDGKVQNVEDVRVREITVLTAEEEATVLKYNPDYVAPQTITTLTDIDNQIAERQDIITQANTDITALQAKRAKVATEAGKTILQD